MATKIVLPTEKAEAKNSWTCQKIGIIGQAGIGKSEFFSHCDKTLYIQTEAGLSHLAVKKLPCRSWDEWRDIYSALLQAQREGKFPYETIVIDTIDKFIDLSNTEVIERGRNKFKGAEIFTIGDIPNGAGWAWATDNIELALSKLEDLPAAICYIGHLDRKEIKKPNNTSIHLQTISIGGKTGRALVAWCDHFINIEAAMVGNNVKRRLRTLPTASVDAKSRGGVVPDGTEWGEDSKANWVKFRGLFS